MVETPAVPNSPGKLCIVNVSALTFEATVAVIHVFISRT
jgi:hypothetical protein